MNKKVFFQDFLFEGIPIDKDDKPAVELEYTDNTVMCSVVNPYQSFDYYNVALNFSDLVEMRDESDWLNMLKKIDSCNTVVLVDNMPLQNAELVPYKEFYMKTYYYTLKQHCKNCFVSISR
ncbi:MAG: hypothetical protein MJ092_06385 [Lachnospiraceae bacterium]|nr:hypothetical protein [Lachnospiraceae bacterium]